MSKADNFIVVIPARYNSSRLPGKPLKNIFGKSMLVRTFDICALVVKRSKIYVATDDKRIANECKKNNINCIMTSKKCLTGTDRIAEVSKKIKKDFYINVQGDEPLFNPNDLKKLIIHAKKNKSEIINGYCPIDSESDFFNVNIPKVILNKKGYLMYMSRAPIPFNKKKIFNFGWRQICAYSLPLKSLVFFSKNKKKTPLESQEDCELLRFIESGFKIKMIQMTAESIAVDTIKDLKKVRNIFKKQN